MVCRSPRYWSRRDHLGDAEIEQFGDPFLGDQNVAGFQIAVHHQVLMRILHRLTDHAEQFQSLPDVQILLFAILRDGQAIDVLHDEVRKPILGRAAIQQSRNKRMLQVRQDLPLLAETPQHGVGIHAALQDLDSDFLLIVIVADCKMNGSHPTGP